MDADSIDVRPLDNGDPPAVLVERGTDPVERPRVVPNPDDTALAALAAVEGHRFFLSALMGNVPDQIYFKDRQSRFLLANEACASRLGVSPEAVIGKSDFDFFAAEYANLGYETEQELLRTGEPIIDVERLEVFPDGHTAWVSTTKVPLRSSDGSIVGILGINRDTTRRKEAEIEIERQKKLLDSLLETSPDAIFFKDREGRFLRVSRAMLALFGASSYEDVVGKTDFDFFADEHARKARADEQYVMTTGQPLVAIEEKEVRPDGSERWVSTTKMPRFDEEGRIIGCFGISRDLTKQKELEGEFRQSQKMEAVGRLAGGIAHDFNNLLTAISGYAELVRSDVSEQPEVASNVEEVIKAAARASRLTTQLLAYSRRQLVQLRVVELGEVLEGLADMLRRLIGEDVRVTMEIAEECTCVRADSSQLEQVVLNLALNARDAMPRGGELRIAVRPETIEGRPGVLLEVADNGEGIDPQAKELLFEPYFTTKERGQGTGLGLATVYGIVRQSGGTIDVESTLGEGATFRLHFPHAQVPCVRGSKSASAVVELTPKGQGETILVVEDEDAVRSLVRESLGEIGYRVVTASNGDEALTLAEDLAFDLLLADVVMPGLNGVQLAETLTARNAGLAVLLMTGYADERLSAHGVLESRFALIEKPFQLAALHTAVRRALEHEPEADFVRPSLA